MRGPCLGGGRGAARRLLSHSCLLSQALAERSGRGREHVCVYGEERVCESHCEAKVWASLSDCAASVAPGRWKWSLDARGQPGTPGRRGQPPLFPEQSILGNGAREPQRRFRDLSPNTY